MRHLSHLLRPVDLKAHVRAVILLLRGVPTLLAKARRLLNVDVGRMEEPQLVR